jgi:hypothetical protein
MYIQRFVKGIAGAKDPSDPVGLAKGVAYDLVLSGAGILSNFWRNHPLDRITPSEIEDILTDHNLDRHLHDYEVYGPETPFISLAAGCVERDAIAFQNYAHSAVDTALGFATEYWDRPGALFFGWVLVSLNPAVEISSVAESVRDLNVYHRWSPWQTEGEITAKIHIPANQIERVEWWDGNLDMANPQEIFANPSYVAPTPILNLREAF